MSSTSKQTSQLSSWEKRVLLAQLLRKKADEFRTFPLSFAQQRLWFLEQWEPGSPFYNIPLALRLTGPLQLSVLEQSLNELLRRHEALRTSFALREGQPVQLIAAADRRPLPLVDLSALPQAECEAQAQYLVTEEAQRPFALARGPLLRT